MEDTRPNVCSFKPDKLCNTKPSFETFGRIQLLDGSTHYVKNLNIRIEELADTEYSCVATGVLTGSPQFCKCQDCESIGTKFCYYKQNDQAFFISDTGKIPVKAWGYTQRGILWRQIRCSWEPQLSEM